jgi:anti-sigma regulatory factor (Ser/Thr protein kinase)
MVITSRPITQDPAVDRLFLAVPPKESTVVPPIHWQHQQEWPGEAHSVHDVRDFVTAHLVRHGLSALVDDAVLVVSELATNVVLHANTPFRVSLSRAEEQLLLEVTDHSSNPPRPAPGDPLSTSGRGLAIVGILSQSWGVHHATNGAKNVWASFPIPRVRDSGAGRQMLENPGSPIQV